MELGSGVALAGLCVSGGAVAITAIRTFANKREGPIGPSGLDGINGKDGINGRNGLYSMYPCGEHSGLVASLDGISKNQDRQDKWLSEIAADVKMLLRK